MSQENYAYWKGKPWEFFLTQKYLIKRFPGGPLASLLHVIGEWSKAFACYSVFHSGYSPNIGFLWNQTKKDGKGETICFIILGLIWFSIIPPYLCPVFQSKFLPQLKNLCMFTMSHLRNIQWVQINAPHKTSLKNEKLLSQGVIFHVEFSQMRPELKGRGHVNKLGADILDFKNVASTMSMDGLKI